MKKKTDMTKGKNTPDMMGAYSKMGMSPKGVLNAGMARRVGLKPSMGKMAVPHTYEPPKKRLAEGGTADSDHWMQNAVKRPGALHKKLGVPEGEKIPARMLRKAEHSKDPLTRKQANFAEIARRINKK